jgi:hypothetical protein
MKKLGMLQARNKKTAGSFGNSGGFCFQAFTDLV